MEYTGFMSLVKIRGAELNLFGNVINLYNWVPTLMSNTSANLGLLKQNSFAAVKSSEAI